MQTIKRMLRKCSHEAPPEIPQKLSPGKSLGKNPQKIIRGKRSKIVYVSYVIVVISPLDLGFLREYEI